MHVMHEPQERYLPQCMQDHTYIQLETLAHPTTFSCSINIPSPFPFISILKSLPGNALTQTPLKTNLGNATPNLGDPDTWPLGPCRRRRHAQYCETSLFQQWESPWRRAHLVNVTAGVPPTRIELLKWASRVYGHVSCHVLGDRFPLLLQPCRKAFGVRETHIYIPFLSQSATQIE